ncbi:USP6 N-terminal-like protein [Vulpes vulpes]|uniref:USP6 N-terminal-like protein n=1 Tax=Vulpes vulpes TaxID=9627 RepID=A0ABM4ZXU3_VULVU
MSTGIYSPKWFLQCFLGRTPFSLTLKLWDAYILDGERVLTAMAYTILKVHRKRLLKLPLEGLREFLQYSLAQPWALEDEAVLRHLRASMTQLRRMRCDLPPPGGLRAPAPPDSACWGRPQGTEPPGPPSSSLGLSSSAPASGTPGQGWAGGRAGAATVENGAEGPQEVKSRATLRSWNCAARYLPRGYRSTDPKGDVQPSVCSSVINSSRTADRAQASSDR